MLLIKNMRLEDAYRPHYQPKSHNKSASLHSHAGASGSTQRTPKNAHLLAPHPPSTSHARGSVGSIGGGGGSFFSAATPLHVYNAISARRSGASAWLAHATDENMLSAATYIEAPQPPAQENAVCRVKQRHSLFTVTRDKAHKKMSHHILIDYENNTNNNNSNTSDTHAKRFSEDASRRALVDAERAPSENSDDNDAGACTGDESTSVVLQQKYAPRAKKIRGANDEGARSAPRGVRATQDTMNCGTQTIFAHAQPHSGVQSTKHVHQRAFSFAPKTDAMSDCDEDFILNSIARGAQMRDAHVIDMMRDTLEFQFEVHKRRLRQQLLNQHSRKSTTLARDDERPQAGVTNISGSSGGTQVVVYSAVNANRNQQSLQWHANNLYAESCASKESLTALSGARTLSPRAASKKSQRMRVKDLLRQGSSVHPRLAAESVHQKGYASYIQSVKPKMEMSALHEYRRTRQKEKLAAQSFVASPMSRGSYEFEMRRISQKLHGGVKCAQLLKIVGQVPQQ